MTSLPLHRGPILPSSAERQHLHDARVAWRVNHRVENKILYVSATPYRYAPTPERRHHTVEHCTLTQPPATTALAGCNQGSVKRLSGLGDIIDRHRSWGCE